MAPISSIRPPPPRAAATRWPWAPRMPSDAAHDATPAPSACQEHPQASPSDRGQRVTDLITRRRRPTQPMRPRVLGRKVIPTQPRPTARPVDGILPEVSSGQQGAEARGRKGKKGLPRAVGHLWADNSGAVGLFERPSFPCVGAVMTSATPNGPYVAALFCALPGRWSLPASVAAALSLGHTRSPSSDHSAPIATAQMSSSVLQHEGRPRARGAVTRKIPSGITHFLVKMDGEPQCQPVAVLLRGTATVRLDFARSPSIVVSGR